MSYFISTTKYVEVEVLDQDNQLKGTLRFKNQSQAEYAKQLIHKDGGVDYTIEPKFTKNITSEKKEEIASIINKFLAE